MLKEGDVVKIGEKEYEVTKTTDDQQPCILCGIRYCYMNKDLDAIKAQHFALNCVDLTPENTFFKEVEQSLQVDCK